MYGSKMRGNVECGVWVRFVVMEVGYCVVAWRWGREYLLWCGRGQIFRIGTVRYAEDLWRMRRHGPVIVHCTDSEDFPVVSHVSVKIVNFLPLVYRVESTKRYPTKLYQICWECS